MATGADHRSCVGYPSFERLLVHIATLADDSGRAAEHHLPPDGGESQRDGCRSHSVFGARRPRAWPFGTSGTVQPRTRLDSGWCLGRPVAWPGPYAGLRPVLEAPGGADRVVIYQLEVGTIASPDAINDAAVRAGLHKESSGRCRELRCPSHEAPAGSPATPD